MPCDCHTSVQLCLYIEFHFPIVKVAERAVEVHGSKDQIEKEKQKKLQKREKLQQKKFDKNVQGKWSWLLHHCTVCSWKCAQRLHVYLKFAYASVRFWSSICDVFWLTPVHHADEVRVRLWTVTDIRGRLRLADMHNICMCAVYSATIAPIASLFRAVDR